MPETIENARKSTRHSKIDLIGQRFGKLTVVSEAEKRNGFRYWNCVCDCGNTVTVRQAYLRCGETRSCGCLRQELAKETATERIAKANAARAARAIDLTGQQFGRLTVIGEAEKRNGARCWHCVCDCGNTSIVRQSHLTSGATRSCGQHRESSFPYKIDITGQRFGKLTVTGFAERRSRRNYWNCVCDCGNTVVVQYSHLVNGQTHSCGCLRAEKSVQKSTVKKSARRAESKTVKPTTSKKPVQEPAAKKPVSHTDSKAVTRSFVKPAGKRHIPGTAVETPASSPGDRAFIDTYCKHCVYRRTLGDLNLICDYLDIIGHCRPRTEEHFCKAFEEGTPISKSPNHLANIEMGSYLKRKGDSYS